MQEKTNALTNDNGALAKRGKPNSLQPERGDPESNGLASA